MKVAFTGHRPDKLGGYDENNVIAVRCYHWLKSKIHGLLAWSHSTVYGRPIETWITGGALGVDTMAAKIIQEAGLHHTLAIPFAGYDSKWSNYQRGVGNWIAQNASQVVVVSEKAGTAAYHVRNAWMVNQCHPGGVLVAVTVEDIAKPDEPRGRGGTISCIQYATRKGIEIILSPRAVILGSE